MVFAGTYFTLHSRKNQRCTTEPHQDLKNQIIQLLLRIRIGIVIFCFFRFRIRIQFWMIANDFNKLLVAYWVCNLYIMAMQDLDSESDSVS